MYRIGIDYTPAYEQGGGIGRYVRELVSALAVQDQTTEYRLFAAGASSSRLSALPGENFRWKPSRISPIWWARLWHRAHVPFPVELVTGKLDLYHATDFVLPPTLPTTRTLLTVHDLSFVRVPETTSSGLKVYLDRVVPMSANRANHILADSQSTKNDLVNLYNLPPTKISVLLSGVDMRFKHEVSVKDILTIRRKYAIGMKPYVFSVGTVQPRKNYSRLIQAVSRLRKSGFDIDLVIAGGPGWLADPIYETLRQEKLEEYVHFTGFVDDLDLPTLYAGALCLAFPSLYEGFGLPVLESMASGTPVVTSNLSSLPEVAGDAAILINPYEVDELVQAIRNLLENSDLRSTLIKRGLDRSKQFTWERAAGHLKQIYLDTVK